MVAGDIGGSFGMKSAVYNEVGAGAAGIEDLGTAGEMDFHALRNLSCATPRRGTTSPSPRSRSTNRGQILAMRAAVAGIRGYLQNRHAGVHRQHRHARRRLSHPAMHADVTAVFHPRNPVRPYRGNGRPEAGYVIERLVDLAADELGLDPAEIRRKN